MRTACGSKTSTKFQTFAVSQHFSSDLRENIGLRRISVRRISIARMAHFAGKSFLFNLHFKWMKFGLFVKPHVSNRKLIKTKSAKNQIFLISEVCLRKSHCITKNFANFAGKHLCWSLFLIKLQTFSALQTFSFEICKVFKNTYLEEYLRTTDCFSDLKHGIWVFHNSMFFLVSKQLPPNKMVLPDNCPLDDCPPNNCPRIIASGLLKSYYFDQ